MKMGNGPNTEKIGSEATLQGILAVGLTLCGRYHSPLFILCDRDKETTHKTTSFIFVPGR